MFPYRPSPSLTSLRHLPKSPPPDCLEFLEHYSHQHINPSANKNLRFYKGEVEALPDGLRIDGMLRMLEGNYEECEGNHGWVQWLYPIRARGVNPHAQPLQPHEIKALNSTSDFQPLFTRSYAVFLNFLGINLEDKASGRLGRVQPISNSPKDSSFDSRTSNFRSNPHNLLRVTRLLKWLNEFDHERDARSLLLFLLAERDAYGWSGRSAFKSSFCGFYVWCFRTESIRDEVMQTVDGVLGGKSFGMKEYRDMI